MTTIPTKTLNDGNTIPALGFGTYALKGEAGVNSIVDAIHSGYRLLDSAFNYENEGTVGQAVRQSGLSRESLMITSKLPGRHQKFDEAIETIEESLYRAQLSYYDIYLIHWPNPKQGLYVEAWKALIEAKKRGLIRTIGVCNFLPEHIEKLIQETGVTPAINQIELHPFFPQKEQLAFDQAHGIVTQAWSPLGRASKILQDPALATIAHRLHKSIPQIILRWHYQLGAIPIPKSSSVKRQVENLSLFDFALTSEDMQHIAGLARKDGRLKNQDPAEYEEF